MRFRANNLSRWLCEGARWIFLGALIFAPWAYGGTTSESIVAINWLLGSALVLWGLGRLLLSEDRTAGISDPEHRWSPPLILTIATLGILIFGWWMVFNAKAIYDSPYSVFVPLPHFEPAMPGSIDYAISAAWMVRATLLLGVIWFVAEFSRDQRWVLRLWWTLALAGGSIATLGLLQKASGAEMIFWQSDSFLTEKTFFATYYYHANAGAYLNLVLPAAIALAIRGFVKRSAPFVGALSLVLCLLLVMASIANTSRGSQAVAALLVVALTVCLRDILFSLVRRIEKKTLLLAAGLIAFTILAMAGASHLDQSLGRWHELQSKLEGDSRWLASRAALLAVGDAGWIGFGPGTFRAVFPRYSAGFPGGTRWVWRFLHEDYLQTVMEWGAGATFWAVAFFGSIWNAMRTLRRRADVILSGRQRLFLTSAVLALGGVALHALVDFPLQIASLQLYGATYVGICWGVRPEVRSRGEGTEVK